MQPWTEDELDAFVGMCIAGMDSRTSYLCYKTGTCVSQEDE